MLLIHKHRVFFYLLWHALISFNVLQFLIYKSFTSLVKFIIKYIIIFDVILSRLFIFGLFIATVQRNVADFCALTLYPFIFLNFFVISNSLVCVYSLQLSIYNIAPSSNSDNLTFQSGCLFFLPIFFLLSSPGCFIFLTVLIKKCFLTYQVKNTNIDICAFLRVYRSLFCKRQLSHETAPIVMKHGLIPVGASGRAIV